MTSLEREREAVCTLLDCDGNVVAEQWATLRLREAGMWRGQFTFKELVGLEVEKIVLVAPATPTLRRHEITSANRFMPNGGDVVVTF